MPSDHVYNIQQIHAHSVTFAENTGFALGTTGIVFHQNGGINLLQLQVYPDQVNNATAGAYTGNFGCNLKAIFYYDGPQLVSSQGLSIGGATFYYAYWADVGGAGVYCNTGGGAMVSFNQPLDAEWEVGARVVPRDSWSDATGRNPQKLFSTAIIEDPLGVVGQDLFSEFKGMITVGTAGLPHPSDQVQPGRLWGRGNVVGSEFSDGSGVASGNTGIIFPQDGGIKWLFAGLRPNYENGEGASEQIGNIKVAGTVKFFYDGPQVSSAATFSIGGNSYSYAYEKDIPITMYCVTNAGHWEIQQAADFNKSFKRPLRIVDRDTHSGGAQQIYVKVDCLDPWLTAFDKTHFALAVATARFDPYRNFKAS